MVRRKSSKKKFPDVNKEMQDNACHSIAEAVRSLSNVPHEMAEERMKFKDFRSLVGNKYARIKREKICSSTTIGTHYYNLINDNCTSSTINLFHFKI